MRQRTKRMGASALAVAIVTVFSGPAVANGFLEERPWQFDTPNERIAKQQLLDLRERKEGGFYDSFRTQTTNNFTTEVQGDQINCNLNASATALGNSGTNTATARNSSPDVSTSGSVSARSSGNEGTNRADGLDPANSGDSNIDGQADGERARGNADGSVSQAGQLISNRQSLTDSPQTSTVSDPTVTSDVRGVDSGGGTTDLALNSTQTNRNSPQNASVSSSEACRIVRPAQTAGVPAE